ncbi:hypothetical protein EVAR_51377_1 [Eumeta japonica]|uniref:RNA-directed DNA polymerase from mobile element jockey n=1 Tax=Eumeta variegata TaxID=151549 RepID=A0A4C1Y2Y0_EUMVA|nr:hypothetical protein EVAR_51377_1 [Eumeta japonica]
MTGYGTLVIDSIYLPATKQLLWSDLKAILVLGDAVILFGDFNCKNSGECLADSTESQCSHASLPHDFLHIPRLEEEVQHKASLEPKDDMPSVSLSEIQKLIKSFKSKRHRASMVLLSHPLPPIWTEAKVIDIHKPGKPTPISDHFDEKGLIID